MPHVHSSGIRTALGADIAESRFNGNIIEFDAVKVGASSSAGGSVYFRCVDAEGVIHPVEICRGVNVGHSVFYGGAQVQDHSQIGNETPVPLQKQVPSNYQLQVRSIRPSYRLSLGSID